MLSINKLISNSTVDYAAEELKKYLRMMNPEGGNIAIAYDPAATGGFRLGLMQDFGLDVSDVEDTELDDILYIDCDGEGGIIAGSNPRSVLLAVYEYLRQNGCRWLFPGPDGEYIPVKQIEAVKYRFAPSCRYRGQCNEGAEFQRSMLMSIDFMPKIGMNTFMIEFKNPHTYYDWYYMHRYAEDSRPPEPVSYATTLQWKRQCEAEIAKRGMMFHDIGHGLTIDPFGIDSEEAWNKVDDSAIPDDTRRYLAMLGGERKLFRGQPINTQFCMSSPEARTRVAKYIAEYAENHSNIDYLHVWLADATNNHCECEECRKKTPSDWYVMLLNEIDECLSEKKLDTRIVFIVYTDTTWAPISERIRNPKRFSSMLAAITRSYTVTLTGRKIDTLPPFNLNKNVYPRDLDEYFAHFREWQKDWQGAAFAYEYHFWRHQACEPTGTVLAKRIIEDVLAYKAAGINGVIEDGSQRSYFPNGFAFYAYARILYDNSLSYERIAEEYFSAAYGDGWRAVLDYLERLATELDQKYVEGERSANPEISNYYNPDYLGNAQRAEKILTEGETIVKAHYDNPERMRTASYRMLEYHVRYCRHFLNVLTNKAVGNDEAALLAHDELARDMGSLEPRIELYYDHLIFCSMLKRIIQMHPTKKPNETLTL